jgi:hypothetical protein
MKYLKIIILLILVAPTASRTIEADDYDQTIGWGRNIANAEDFVADHGGTLEDEKLILQMAEEEQALGMGD